MVEQTRYTAKTLAAACGVTERTVRWYVEAQLLPPPAQRGRGAHFGEGHLVRLRLIRLLQEDGLDLEGVREYLGALEREGQGSDAIFENALGVWSRRREAAEARVLAARFGGPGVVVHRYDVCEGVSLHIEHLAAPGPARLKAALKALRAALAAED
jgi:DNA-binding transcriptional MerR regulator